MEFLLFPIDQLENAIARLPLVQLTPSKACYVLAYTGRPCFRAHLWGGAARFGASVLLLVLLQWSFVVPHCPTWKCNCLASTGPIDPIQSLLCICIHWATMFQGTPLGWRGSFWCICSALYFAAMEFCCSSLSNLKMQLLGFYWSDWPHPKLVMYLHTPGTML